MTRDDPTVGRPRHATFTRYEAMRGGLPNYWYPVIPSRDVGSRPVGIRVLDQPIVLVRDTGAVHALHDRCPHRGIPLSLGRRWEWMPGGGRREFAGTLSCAYHGWTYDLETGRLVAALTDGPDSAIVERGCIGVRTYPVEERQGLIWVWVGDREPVPLEEDVDPDFLRRDAVVCSWVRVMNGNWRDAAENGYDPAHFFYLHRTAFGYLFSRGEWTAYPIVGERRTSPDGKEIDFDFEGGPLEAEYPGLGSWPKRPRYTRLRSLDDVEGSGSTPFRLPGALRVNRWPADWLTHFEWYVPVDETHYRYVQTFVHWTSNPLKRAAFRAWYRLWGRWIWHQNFNSQDFGIVANMSKPPLEEILFRPDSAVRQLRRFIESDPRWDDAPPVVDEEG
jgi:phenylpropionate dioxygenase-like ring-hydroxylating dioxygenase large terminal subunit